ncbi:hypothetical protein BT69DRAFT_1284589 [Atractiella rhizophila]|nr:hypothetical protein BT69DRAFT_1284589 [Atractiella rhizophila]
MDDQRSWLREIPTAADPWQVKIPESSPSRHTTETILSPSIISQPSNEKDGFEDTAPPVHLSPEHPRASQDRTMIVGRVGGYRSSLWGRNPKYFLGWDKNDPTSMYFVKASWPSIGEGRAVESTVYEELRGSKHVQQMICGGHPEGPEYTTINVPDWQQSKKEQLPGQDNRSEAAYPSQRLHLLVLPFVRPLSSLQDGYELLVGIYGLHGLPLGDIPAGYLHRDISDSNVALTFPGPEDPTTPKQQSKREQPVERGPVKGILQDFDFAVKRSLERKLGTSRVGTYVFMASQLVDTEPRCHRLIHDVESLYHILTLNTYFHLHRDPRWKPEETLAGYFGTSAASVKNAEIFGVRPKFRRKDVRNIHILGPLILLFRYFLMAHYSDEDEVDDDERSSSYKQEQPIKKICSRLKILDGLKHCGEEELCGGLLSASRGGKWWINEQLEAHFMTSALALVGLGSSKDEVKVGAARGKGQKQQRPP